MASHSDRIVQVVCLVQTFHEDGRTSWLLKQGSGNSGWQFIVGTQFEGESPREVAAREVAWEMGLDRERDFLVSSMAIMTLEPDTFAEMAPPSGPHSVAFYPVMIYRTGVLNQIATAANFRWATSAEICAGRFDVDQAAIDPLVVKWINRWGVIQSWRP